MGVGEAEKQEKTAPPDVKEWLLSELRKCRASRPLIVAQKTQTQRSLLDMAFAELEAEGSATHFGEGRAKIWAIAGVKADEAEMIRDEQKASSVSFDPLSAMISDGTFVSFKNAGGAIRFERKDCSFAKLQEQPFESYHHFKLWIMEQLNVPQCS